MTNLPLNGRNGPISKILCLGAHSDDIEIGCGGTILKWLDANPSTDVCWVVMGASGQRRGEATQSAERFLANAGSKRVIIKEFRDGFLPYAGAEVKDFFEELKKQYSPDLILTHYRDDLHQDHRMVSQLTWNTFRNHLILEYEIVKYDGDLGVPNLFVTLTESVVNTKIGIILDCFQSQRSKAWFTPDAFSSILRLRGIESNAPDRFAEAFYCRKMVY